MFLQNKYTKHYELLISKALKENRKKSPSQYFEVHHILPKSVFPEFSEDKDNIILLTAKEHFIAHLLLTKMFVGKDKSKMVWALWGMQQKQGDRIVVSRTYELLKPHLKHTEETKAKISNALKGIIKPPLTEERKKNISLKLTGKKRSEETKDLMRGANNHFYGKTHTPEVLVILSEKASDRPREKHTEQTKEKIRNSLLGVPHTEERKQNISKALTGKVYLKRRGKIWATDGKQNVRVAPNAIPEGFIKGMTKKK